MSPGTRATARPTSRRRASIFFAFSGALEIDDSSHERWLQSCLQGLVAPGLVVDGAPGAKTREAIRTFQRRIRALRPGARALSVDGIAGPTTIAALEAVHQLDPASQRQARPSAEVPTPKDARADRDRSPCRDRRALAGADPQRGTVTRDQEVERVRPYRRCIRRSNIVSFASAR
jgi:lysozyme family protein